MKRGTCSGVLGSVLLGAACSPAPHPGEPAAPRLVTPADFEGARVGPGCEPLPAEAGGPRSMRRAYVFTQADWSIDLTQYADGDCAEPIFALGLAGRYVLGPAVSDPAGARIGDFYRDAVTVTPLSEAGQALLTAICGARDWVLGEAADVTETGCAGVPTSAACPIDRDIVGLVDGGPAPGVRTADMCVEAGRPTQLQSAPLRRADAAE